MSDPRPVPPPGRWQEVLSRLASVVLGGVYVYMGLSKALHPVDFLKLVREYGLVDGPPLLNLIAATLPWFEAFCGLLLLAGVAVRGVALVSLGMLLPFTVLVWQRASALQAVGGLPFCAIRFDCGCGAGEVLICYKLAENIGLILLSAWLLIARQPTRCLWFAPLGPRSPSGTTCA
jgi:uncharacterized membrane protein YphA (DoxX/SURF4 family)